MKKFLGMFLSLMLSLSLFSSYTIFAQDNTKCEYPSDDPIQ